MDRLCSTAFLVRLLPLLRNEKVVFLSSVIDVIVIESCGIERINYESVSLEILILALFSRLDSNG